MDQIYGMALVCHGAVHCFQQRANDNLKASPPSGARTHSAIAAHWRWPPSPPALGSLLSLLLADGLVQQFSGKGLVPDTLASAPEFILSVSCGAGLTVFIATRLGLPVSTTHALIGGLIGAGIGHSPALVNFDKLLNTFLLPLLLSPLLAGLIGVYQPAIAAIATRHRTAGTGIRPIRSAGRIGDKGGTPAFSWLSQLHIASAMAICFARGVNDTPKLAALMIAAQLVSAQQSIGLIAATMALGGWLFAHKVAKP